MLRTLCGRWFPLSLTLFFLGPGVFAQRAVPNEFVVLLKKGAPATSFFSAYKVESQTVFGLPIHLIRIPNMDSVISQTVLENLRNRPEVDLIEPNYIYTLDGEEVIPPSDSGASEINDPDLAQQWGLRNLGQPDGWGRLGRAGMDNSVMKAWGLQKGSKDTIVAVIDSGVNYLHPELVDNIWTNKLEEQGKPGVDDDNNGLVDDIHGYDFVNEDGDPMDDHGHGTHVSSIIGAKPNNGLGMAGVNWNVSIMAIKFASSAGKGDLNRGIKAIQYATQMGARIINNSWGGVGYSEVLSRVVEAAKEKNVLLVNAAGNSGWDNAEKPIFPASLKNENVLSIAAFDQHGQLWNGSCYGTTTVHFGAPGFDIWGLSGDKFRRLTGTSMAAPHVTGVAALVLSQEPQLSVLELKERLMRTAKPVANLRDKTITGATVDAYAALTNTMPSLDLDDPVNWEQKRDLHISTAHPYENQIKQEWEVSFEGAREMSLFFENFQIESKQDRVDLFDRTGKRLFLLTGKTGKGWSPIISGDYVKVILTTDDFRNDYGFDLTKAAIR